MEESQYYNNHIDKYMVVLQLLIRPFSHRSVLKYPKLTDKALVEISAQENSPGMNNTLDPPATTENKYSTTYLSTSNIIYPL